jgi:hypothetical protein
MISMPPIFAALAAQTPLSQDEAEARLDAQVIDLDDIAQRRERLQAYAAATRPVVVYRFVIPPGARVAALGSSGASRDAAAQLELIVGLTGGALTRSLGGAAARIPKVLSGKFEAMAAPLIEAYLVSLDLGDAADPLA